MISTEISPQLPTAEHSERQEAMTPETKEKIMKTWKEIVAHPESLTDLSEKKVVFVAGGGLPSRFGAPESDIWQALMSQAQEGQVQVAGIPFQLEELALLGDYYRFLRDTKSMALHCIDERLVDDLDHEHDEVHDKCGACAAVAAAAHIEGNLEDQLLSELGQEQKQGVYDDMPDHESVTILVDFHGADVVLGDKRAELKAEKALPFNVSMPLELISEWAVVTGNNPTDLINVLAKWNVQIARAIIGGHHNTLHTLADQTLIVTDQREVSQHPLLGAAAGAVDMVQHGSSLIIADQLNASVA